VPTRVLLGKKCVCDIEKRGGKYRKEFVFSFCKVYGFSWFFVGVWFYLKYEKRKK
jgi:hypothetical protein